MEQANPAKVFAAVFGAVLVAAGIIGFFYNSDLTNDSNVHSSVFGLFAVNGWHNLLHILTGVIGLAAVTYFARPYALVVGASYVAIAVWGFILGTGGSLLSIVPVNTADSVLHLAIGVAGLAAAAASLPETAATPAPRS